MSAKILFPKVKQDKLFQWKDARTWFVRTQYNEMLDEVLRSDEKLLAIDKGDKGFLTADDTTPPNYYHPNYCLTLQSCAKSEVGPLDVVTLASNKKEEKSLINAQRDCYEQFNLDHLKRPKFFYQRIVPAGNPIPVNISGNGGANATLDFAYNLEGITVGAVLWLYFYERMGIFKILGALMDDYNYRGKFPLSGKLDPGSSGNNAQSDYPSLMDKICTLYRLGIGSNLRDRICLYQRVLGVSIDNNLNIVSEVNTGFFRDFNALLTAKKNYYRAKQLAQAIRDTNDSIRSSVATQTTIRDTMQLLQKNFEALEYGRNRLNAFLGIATVFGTICLLRMLKDEIGVPRQYNDPHEFIPAAYEILVAKGRSSSMIANRFTIYDNCASYGYRLLTDIELADTAQLTTVSLGSTLDLWLNDVEGIVEGYLNAYASVTEKAAEMV